MKKDLLMPCLFAAVIGTGVGYVGYSASHKSEQEFCKRFDEVIEAYDVIEKYYYTDDIDERRVEQELVKGLVKGLDDRFTSYNTEEEETTGIVNISPSVEDSGYAVERDLVSKMIKLTKVEKDSQAEKAGLQEGDLITAIDDLAVERDNYPEAARKLLGKDGTKMKLTVRRGNETFDVDFTRVNNGPKDEEEPYTAEILDNGIGYLKFDSFKDNSAGTPDKFRDIVDGLQKEKELKGLIVDLRSNVGGVATNAVSIFDYFSGAGSTLKMVETKNEKHSAENTTTDEVLYDMPLAVLVSGDTYSAAEIFTAFVQSTGRGTVIGTQTGGKGVYQFGEYLSDTTMITLVEGYYYVNDVPNYNDIGLTPDVTVEMDKTLIGTDEDVQLKKAIELME